MFRLRGRTRSNDASVFESPWSLAFLAGLTVLVGALGYDLLVVPPGDPTVPGWDVSGLDWPFLSTTLALVCYGVGPLAARPRRALPPPASPRHGCDGGPRELPTFWWIPTVPPVALAVAALSFNVLADGLRGVPDPRTRA